MGVIRYMSWIATKKQMPPIGKKVLIFTTSKYYRLAERISKRNDMADYTYDFLIISAYTNSVSKECSVFTDYSMITREDVVCWMYVPELIISNPELIISKKKKVIKKVSIFELMDI